jgi:hypothetical protein
LLVPRDQLVPRCCVLADGQILVLIRRAEQ